MFKFLSNIFSADKKITKKLKLQIMGGAATPAPPVGPALGQAGINIGEFVSKFNEPIARKLVPLILKVALSSAPNGKLNVNIAPVSGSVPLKVPTTALAPAFSATELLARTMSVGVSFASVTEIVNCLSKVNPP